MHPIQSANVRNLPVGAVAAVPTTRKSSGSGRVPLPNLALRPGINPPPLNASSVTSGPNQRYIPSLVGTEYVLL